MNETVPTGDNGRAANGQFLPGNAAARGNPLNRRAQQLRAALLSSVQPEDVEAILAKLIEAARAGDTVAAREVLDRTIGKASASDILWRIEQLEQAIQDV